MKWLEQRRQKKAKRKRIRKLAAEYYAAAKLAEDLGEPGRARLLRDQAEDIRRQLKHI